MQPPQPPRREPASPPAHHIRHCISHLLPAAAILVIASFATGFFGSDYFRITEVIVRSPNLGIAEEVRGVLQVPDRASTIFYPVERFVEQAQTCSRVKSAKVTRELPGRLILTITERQPCFALRTDSDYVVFDREGVLLFHTGRTGPALPVVVGPVVDKHVIGGRLRQASLQSTLSCMEGAQKAGLNHHFILDLKTPYDYRMLTPTGTLIKLGGPDNLARKVIIAAAAERHLKSQNARVAYIDVRVPTGQVYYKLLG